MFRQVRKKVLRTMLLCSAVLLLLAAGCFFMQGGAGVLQLLQQPRPAEDLETFGGKGCYVIASFNWCLGHYAQELIREGGTEQPVSADYLMQLQNGKWIGVRLREEKLQLAQQLADACNAAPENGAEHLPAGFELQGAAIKMKRDVVVFLENSFGGEAVLPGRYGEGRILPYVILVDEVSVGGRGYRKADAILAFAVVVASLIAAVVFPIYGGLSLWKKNILRYCKAQPNPEPALIRLEEFADFTANTGLIKMNDRWIMAATATTIHVMDTAHVVWVYPSMAKAKLYGLLTIHKIYSLNFAKDDGKTIAINGSREEIEETMAAITQKSSHIMVGADERLYQIYRQKDSERLKRIAKIVRQEKQFI